MVIWSKSADAPLSVHSYAGLTLHRSERQYVWSAQPIRRRTGLRLDAPFYCVHSQARWSPGFVCPDWSFIGILCLFLPPYHRKATFLGRTRLPVLQTKQPFVIQEMTTTYRRYEHCLACLFGQVSFACNDYRATFASGEPGQESLLLVSKLAISLRSRQRLNSHTRGFRGTHACSWTLKGVFISQKTRLSMQCMHLFLL